MCRLLGCVAGEPMSLRRELLEGETAMVRRASEEVSGWGMAVYSRPEGNEPPHAQRLLGNRLMRRARIEPPLSASAAE